MKLPIYKSNDNTLMLLETNWKQLIDPVLSNSLINGNFLTNIALINGATVINHLLGRTPQGWIVTDLNASATIYRSANFNPTTLTLTSSAAVTVNLYVF